VFTPCLGGRGEKITRNAIRLVILMVTMFANATNNRLHACGGCMPTDQNTVILEIKSNSAEFDRNSKVVFDISLTNKMSTPIRVNYRMLINSPNAPEKLREL